MRLFPRLLWMGAVVPAIAAGTILAGAAWFFRLALDDELDRALLAQAAVEAVSLFDGPSGTLHLHLRTSPLLPTVRPYAPRCAVYDHNGVLQLAWPDDASLPTTLAERPAGTSLSTSADGQVRALVVPVREPGGQRQYFLRMEASRTRVLSTTREVLRVGVVAIFLLLVVLGFLAAIWARQLTGRVQALQSHMARIGNGELDANPTVDEVGDELSALRDSIALATRELREARRLQDRFIADAAHELRTPLASMRVALDLALRRPRSHDELLGALREARDETERLARLAHDLLDTSAVVQSPLAPVAVDVTGVVDAAFAACAARAAEREVTLHREGTGVALVDPGALRRILDNLLDNARKHAPPRTAVTVAIHPSVGGLEIVVIDEGPGIPSALRDEIFAPFRRARPEDGGHGLGLALVRDLVMRQGGRAFVKDGPGGRVGVSLPTPAQG
jgi:signal transduction histidine kinase